MSREKIKKITEKCPSNYAVMIAERLGITKKTVYTALDRGKMDHPVIIELLKLAEEHRAKLKKIEERIDKIAS